MHPDEACHYTVPHEGGSGTEICGLLNLDALIVAILEQR